MVSHFQLNFGGVTMLNTSNMREINGFIISAEFWRRNDAEHYSHAGDKWVQQPVLGLGWRR
jgi:hypothetical protein